MKNTFFVTLVVVYVFLSDGVCHGGNLQGYTSCVWGSAECNPCVQNVVWKISTLREYGDIMGFHMNGYTDVTWSDHWQGVQRLMGDNSEYMVVSRSHPDTGGFAVVRMDSRNKDGRRFRSNRLEWKVDVQDTAPPSSDGIAHYEPIDSDYDHAGGIQAIGDWVAIPLEGSHSGANAKVVFYNLSNPESPVKASYEVLVPSDNAGTASITKLSDGRYLLIVGGSDALPLYFYISAGTSLASNPDFPTEPDYTWNGNGNWQAYQNINIVIQDDGKLYLIGTHKNNAGQDWIDVFSLEMDASTYAVTITEVDNRHVYASWGSVPRQCDFDAAAGVYVDPDRRIIVYATEHDNDGPISGDPGCTNGPDCSTKCMEFRSQYYPTSCGTIHDGWVELYDDHDWEDRGLMIDFPDRELEAYNNFNYVENFNDKNSSVRWCMPVGFRYALYEHDNYGGAVKHLYGGGSWQEMNFNGFGDDASSGRFECEINGQWDHVPNLILSGVIYNGNGGPLNLTHSPYIVAGDITVPDGEVLTIASGVTLIINNGKKISSVGTTSADGSGGTIHFVSSADSSRGIKLDGEMRLQNGGSIKFP